MEHDRLLNKFTVNSKSYQNKLTLGTLYRVESLLNDCVLAWNSDSFAPLWNVHKGSLQEAVDQLKSNIVSIPNKDIVLYCGDAAGYTNRAGNGIYLRFSHKEKIVYISRFQLSNICFYKTENEANTIFISSYNR